MEKEFIPYDIALKLKELGFDKPCIKGFYNKEPVYTVVTSPVDFNNKEQTGELVSAPTFNQAFRWLREKHNLLCHVEKGVNPNNYYPVVTNISYRHDPRLWFDSYEEAELACLIELIKIVKQ